MKSVRELAGEYRVASATVQQALRVLREEGLITTWQGRGTFVRRTPAAEPINDTSAAVIMHRLDEVLDRVEQLEHQVSQLQGQHESD